MSELPQVRFDTAHLRIATQEDTASLRVELATSRRQQAVGLMERTSLGADAGMLFLYEQPQPDSAVFWMFRTRIPLDIAFVDDSGVIGRIESMEPCTSPYPRWCPRYPAGTEFSAALEVNRGYFEYQGITVGDRLLLGDLIGSRAAE